METRHDEDWNNPPESNVRRAKTAMEDELLIKLGVKRENIEFHPLIKHQRVDRCLSSNTLRYQRIKPPFREKSCWIRNAWKCNNVAMRQMSDLARRGPRDVTLDPGAKGNAQRRRLTFPAGDPEYHKKRAARFKKLAELLEEWRVYHQQAFEPPELDQLDLDKLDTHRPSTSSSRASCRSPTLREKAAPVTLRIKSARPRKRTMAQKWINMKREMLLNLKAAKLRIDRDVPRSEVRIYLSSTPDMGEEREFLGEVAGPELRRYCEKIGINCHLVDLRTGSNELNNDLTTFKICELEMEKCRKRSIGPSFVCLVGEQMDQDIPGFLSKEELEDIREVVIKQKIEGVELLDEYYRLDTNRLPPLYELAREDLYNLPDAEEAMVTLKDFLLEAMKVLRDTGKLSWKTIDFYKWSICAKEIETGLSGCKEPQNQLLCFMKQNSKEIEGSGFAHLNTIIKHYFENKNCVKNIVPIPRGKGKKTLEYMRSLCNVFLHHVINVIARNLDKQHFYMSDHLSESADLTQHLQLQKQLLNSYTVKENQDIEQKIKDAIENPNYKRTLVICGDSGSGKSSFVSYIAECSTTWNPAANLVIRFLGRSLRTSTLFHTLKSICKQIAFLYDQICKIPPQATLIDIIRIFRTVLKNSSQEVDSGPLVIILDGLDNIPDLEPHHVWGLLDEVPLNISIILTVDRQHPYLKLLKNSPQIAEYVTMQEIGGAGRKDIVNAILSSESKTTNEDQQKLIMKQIRFEETPLTLTAVSAMALQWPSHTMSELGDLDTPVEAFQQLIRDSENEVGAAFTKYSLCYLEISKHGLHDSELLHLVLSDSDLLDELQEENSEMSVLEGYPYQTQLSKLFLWFRSFLDDRKVEGETLKRIGHKSLSVAIRQRYLKDGFTETIHKQLASFFQYTRRGLLLTAKDITEGGKLSQVSQNWRNLRSIPYHLCHSSNDVPNVLKTLKEAVLLNFSWVINEIASGYMNDFLFDIKNIISCLQLDEDVFLVRRLLLILRPVIEENPTSLASIVSQFPSHHSHYFNEFIEQAKDWMKQVHTTILIPSPSSGFFSGTFFYGNVTGNSTGFLTSSDGLYLVSFGKGKFETIELGTAECLASVEASPQRAHVWGSYHLTGIMDNALKTWDILGGKLLRKVPLGINRITWMNVLQDGTVYLSSDNQIRRLQAVTGTPATVIKAPEQIRDAGMSQRALPTIVTLHVQKEWCVRIWEMADPQSCEVIELEEKPFSSHCQIFHVTNDGKYAVVVHERQAVVLAILDQEIEGVLSVDDEVIHVVIFTKSYDHMFLASDTGKIRGHLLNSGTLLFSASVFGGDAKKQKNESGHISAMATSEDDHFLMVGLTKGLVIVMNIPSGQRVQYITSHTERITQLYYMTDQIHFQHLISLDQKGVAKLWNLQNIIRSARERLFEIMWDDDLVQEESQKIDLPSYYRLYQKQGKSKMFLNGPDVSAFYNKTDENIFVSGLTKQSGTGWEQSGRLHDCVKVTAANTALGRGDIIITFSDENKIAWWDVRHESLLSVRVISPGGRFHRFRSVFFDQAACLITKDSADRETITVVYGAGKKKKVIQKEKVLRCDISSDTRKMATVTVSRQAFKLTIVDISSEEEQKFQLHLGSVAGSVSIDRARVTLSKDLNTVLGFLKVEDRTLILSWNVADVQESNSRENSHNGETAPTRATSAKSSATDSSIAGEVVMPKNMTELNLRITKARFYTDSEVLVGSRDGEIYVLDPVSMKVVKTFTKDSIVACKSIKPDKPKPHRSAIRSMYFTPDYNHLLTTDSIKVCVWNMKRKVLLFMPAVGDKMTNAVLSKEGCFTLAGLSTGVIRLWANYHRKLLYSFRMPNTIYHVALTPDNSRVIALVEEENGGKRVVVFEAKNTDDYILDRAESESQQNAFVD